MPLTNPYVYQALAIKHALILYARTGLKANSAYTPKNMLATASRITGQRYKRGEYHKAAQDIQYFLDNGSMS